jgi:sugar phosphate isomerase/epimerase
MEEEEADATVPDRWHTTLAALVEFTGIFLPLSFYRNVKDNYRLLVPLLAGCGRCPPGYGKIDVNLIIFALRTKPLFVPKERTITMEVQALLR